MCRCARKSESEKGKRTDRSRKGGRWAETVRVKRRKRKHRKTEQIINKKKCVERCEAFDKQATIHHT